MPLLFFPKKRGAALGAAAAAWAIGITGARIAEELSRAPQVPGRLELISEAPAVLRHFTARFAGLAPAGGRS